MFLPFISFLGGLALFLYGMQLMGDGLQKAAGEKMKSILAMHSHRRHEIDMIESAHRH